MPENNTFVTVKIGDATSQWTLDQYEKGKDVLFSKYPDAEVVRTSVYDPEEGIAPGDAFAVKVGENVARWTPEQMSAGYNQLKSRYPDAEVIKQSNLSEQYWKPKADEAWEKLRALEGENQGFEEQYVKNLKQTMALDTNGVTESQYHDFIAANRDRFLSLRSDRDELRKEYFNNPWVKGQASRAASEATRLRDEYRANMDTAQSGDERRDWRRAAKLQDDIRKIYEAPNKYVSDVDDMNGFAKFLNDYGSGAVDKFTDQDFYTFGLSAISRNFDLREIAQKVEGLTSEEDIDKVLSPGEKAQLMSFYQLADAQRKRADGISSGYTAGGTAAESLKFMAEFLLSSGLANLAGKGLSASSNALASWLGKQLMSERALTRAIGKGVTTAAQGSKAALMASEYLAKPIIQGLWHTATQASTLETISDGLLDTDNNGRLVTVGHAIGKGLLDSLVENWSESVGGALEKTMALPFQGLGWVGEHTIGKTPFGRWARWLYESAPTQLLKEAGFNGMLGEIAEEWAGNAVRVGLGIMSPEEFSDFASWEQQLEMAASFAPMSLFGLGTASASAIRKSNNLNKLSGRVKDIMQRQGRSQEEIDDLFNTKFDTAEDVGRKLAPYLREISAEAQVNGATQQAKEDYRAFMDFAQELGIKAVVDEMQEIDRAERRTDLYNDLYATVGKFWQEDDSVPAEQRHVRVVTDADGQSYYVLGQDETGKMVAISPTGEHKYLEPEQVDFDETTTIEDYLQKQVESIDRDAEAGRMNEERAAQIKDVQAVIAQNPVVPIGTEAKPINATVVAQSPAGVTVVWEEEGEQKTRTMTWADVSAYLGSPIDVKTDEQLEQDAAAELDATRQRLESYRNIAKGTEMVVNMPTEEDGVTTPERFQFQRAVMDDGQIMFYGQDEQGNSMPFTEDMVGNIEQMLQSSQESLAESGEPVAEAPVETPQEVPAVAKYTSEDGTVNQTAFLNNEPAEWAKWNDARRNDGGAGTVQVLSASVRELDKKVAAAQKAWESEPNPDEADAKEQTLRDITATRDRMAAVLSGYAVQEQQPAAEEAPAEEETPAEEPVPASAVDRIRKDEKGNMLFEEATEAETADALLELAGDDIALATSTARNMIAKRDEEARKAAKAKVTGADPVQMIQNTRAKEQKVKALEDGRAYWERVAEELDRRLAAVAEAAPEEPAAPAESEAVAPAAPAEAEPVETVDTAVAEEIAAAEAEVDLNPTDAQKEAGNYRKGHVTIDGYNISIENPKGSVRSGTDAQGNPWSVTMNNTYGYIRMTEGVDGDQIDVFLSDNPAEGNVFVIDQVNPETGEFDEHKVMYGFASAEEASAAYLANYSHGWKGLGTITEVTKEEFRKWIDSSNRKTKPFSEYKSVNAVGAQNAGAQQEAAAPQEEQPLTEAQRKALEFVGADEQQARVLAELKRQAPLQERIAKWRNVIGDVFNVLTSIDDVMAIENESTRNAFLAEKANGGVVHGFYDVETKQAYLYLPDIKNTRELDRKVLHEVISHKGLAGVMGEERFNAFLDHVWNDMMDEESREQFMSYVGGNEASEADRRKAADEYVAHVAEHNTTILKQLDETGWERFVNAIKEVINDMLGEDFFDTGVWTVFDKELGDAFKQYRTENADAIKEADEKRRQNNEKAEDVIEYLYGDNVRMSKAAARLSDKGISSSKDEVRFSVKYVPKAGEVNGIAADIARRIGVSKAEAKRWIKSETSLAAIIVEKENSPYLDYTADDRFEAIKKNSDYPQGTVDFNNICRKRIEFTEMYQRIQKAYPNVVITGEDLARIRNIMKAHGITVACGLCYVEDRRQLLGEIAEDFINNYRSGFAEYTARGGNTKAKNAAKFLNLIGEDRKDDLSIYDLITIDGSTALSREHPGIYNAFQAFNNARGQQAGNLFQGYAEYKREILKWGDKKVQRINDLGGLRVFSYSDFEAHHLIDLVQIIQDCARRGVKMQGYTKVPAFARAIANTGLKINRSLIPLGDTGIVDGKLAYDPVEGIDINDKDFLESNDNVGNILIGINDEQVRLAMNDPFVHMIIPYHSNQKEVLRSMKQTGNWTNYRDSQTEKDAQGKAAENVNIYTDVINAAEAEGKPIEIEKQFTERFLAVCKERDLTPRFAQFLDRNNKGEYVYTPGYYKLLVDFKMFDESGAYLPQRPVAPVFDDAFNAEILRDYVKGEKQGRSERLDGIYDEIVKKLDLSSRVKNVRFSRANQTENGFISNALAALDQVTMDKATPQQWVKMLTDKGGMKAGEDKWLGLSDWLKGQDRKTITKQEIADYIAENHIQIEEVQYGDIEENEKFIELNNEYKRLVESAPERAQEIEDELTAFWGEMEEKYGEDYEYSMTGGENTHEDDLIDARDRWRDDPEQAAYDEMVDNYGDDFSMAFTLLDGELAVGSEDAAAYYLDIKPINSIRMDYTTENLGNKREIALTVPTIDPWNERDDIHFGDAGEGRAVAWIRFGDAYRSAGLEEAKRKYDEAAEEYKKYRDEIIAKYALKATGTKKTIDLATPEETKKARELYNAMLERQEEMKHGNHSREKVLFIDEIQSKRHQEAREQGGYRDDEVLKKAKKRMDEAYEEYNGYLAKLTEKYGTDNGLRGATPEEDAESQRLYRAYRDAEQVVARNGFDPMEDEEFRKLREEQDAFEHSEEFQKLIEDWRNATDSATKEAVGKKLEPLQERNRDYLLALEAKEKNLAAEFNASHKSQIPAAPFEKNWHELAMKRMLRLAAEEGYDFVAWTTGEQQSERYNLAQQVSEIAAKAVGDDRYRVVIEDSYGSELREYSGSGKEMDAKELSGLVGKELATRLITGAEQSRGREWSGKGKNPEYFTIKGDDLRIGGEGMKGFYDGILVNFMNKYGKKWGTKVDDISLPHLEKSAQTAHAVRVTPEMKESVLQGQLMFSRAYHGTGADFERFDSSHMGEGEGNQAYGWGTYVAFNREVGLAYARQMGGDTSRNEELISRWNEELKNPDIDDSRREELVKAISERQKEIDAVKGNRHLYIVEIPEDDGYNYLHWDEPITKKQSERIIKAVKENMDDKESWGDMLDYELLSSLGYGTFGNRVLGGLDYFLGNLYDYATDTDAGAERNSKLLRSIGIVGMVHPAHGVNGEELPDEPNVVIYDENDIKVAEHLRFSKEKKKASETAYVPSDDGHQPTVVSDAAGAKIVKNLETLADSFENLSNQPKFFIGSVAKALGARRYGSGSQYATFETVNGRIITIRLSDHNAHTSGFDHSGNDDGISIVISPERNQGINNDGKAHVVEYYYDAIKLRRAEGKPLADIIRSIQQSLYSGEYKDPTGLAERQEVNNSTLFSKAYHGSGQRFDRFDHSHMGEGEGAQAHGWGTYVTFNKGIAERYATTSGRSAGFGERLAIRQSIRDLMQERDDRQRQNNEIAERHQQWIKDHPDASAEEKERHGKIAAFVLYDDPQYKALDDEIRKRDLLANSLENAVTYKKADIHTPLEEMEVIADATFQMNNLPNPTVEKYLEFYADEAGRASENAPMRKAYEFVKGTTDEDWVSNRYLYEVEIPDDTGENYLDEQAKAKLIDVVEVYDALAKLAETDVLVFMNLPDFRTFTDNHTGYDNGSLYSDVAWIVGSQKEASKLFERLGYVGIKYDGYIDGECAVIFNEDYARITEGIRFSKRTKPAPSKTGIGYKVFFRGKDGKLYPPMVANPDGADTPIGVWLDADAAPVAGTSKTGRLRVKAGGKGTQGGSGSLSYRPGWHLGEIPYALQFNRVNPETGEKELFPRDFVWAEVEYAADVDYQKDAEAEGINKNGKFQHSLAGLKRVPEDGFYRYRTNPNPETDPWIITGAMKVNRILTNEEVDDLVRKAGREPQEREPKVRFSRITPEQDKEYLDAVKAGDMDKAWKMVRAAFKAAFPNTKVVDENGEPLVVYHGTQHSDKKADFNVFNLDSISTGRTFGDGFYFTNSKELGENYAKRYIARGRAGVDDYENLTPRLIPAFLNIENIIDVSVEGLNRSRDLFYEIRVKESDYRHKGIYPDGKVVRGIKDGYDIKSDVYVVESASQIKSADPVTYDDNGNIIPLSERFNENNPDIRFSRAYHGSAADFDAFDTNYVGTGEGAQAHGWGTYVSMSDKTATRYSYLGLRDKVVYRGPKPPTHYAGELVGDIVIQMREGHPFVEMRDSIIRTLKRYEEQRSAGELPNYWKNVSSQKEIDFIEGLKEGDFEVNNSARNLYTVDIPDDNGHNYLDEEKTVRKPERVKIAEALRALPESSWRISEDEAKLFKDYTAPQLADRLENRVMNGKDIYVNLSHGLGSPKAASEFLSSLGFVGIKYDGKVDGECAVIFDGKDLGIEDHQRLLFSRAAANMAREEGIGGVIGEDNVTDFYMSLYRALPEETRQDIINGAMPNGVNIRSAVARYVSDIARSGNDASGILQVAKTMIQDYAEGELDDSTLRYVLWRGDSGVNANDALSFAEDQAMYNRFREGNADVRFSSGNLSSSLESAERTADVMVDNAKTEKDHQRQALKGDLRTVVRAMSAQKEYDKRTVEAVTNLAKQLLKDQSIDALSRREASRLLGIVRTSVGRAPKTVKKNADAIVEMVIEHLLNTERKKFKDLTSITGTKVNTTGVEVQGSLDIQGQKTLKAFREGIKLEVGNIDDGDDANTLYGMRARLQQRKASKDDAVRKEAEAEDAGLALAIEYKEGIKDLDDEESALETELKDLAAAYKDGDLSKTSYEQAVAATYDAIRENHIDQVDAYRDFRHKLEEMIVGSVDAKKSFLDREEARIEQIHHLANSDMQGRSASKEQRPGFLGKLANSPVVRFFAAPLATFDQMLRLFGEKSISGEGYLYNKYMRGWLEASEKAYLGQRDAKAELDRKASEVFGKEMLWSDIYDIERKMGTVTVRWWDDGGMKDHELTQGQLLYIYMVDKMADGRMKLRRMGIEEDAVRAIVRKMDGRFLELADWLQDEYLVNLRNKYNAVHERLFGASMAAIDNYFPLVINKRDLNRNEDIAAPDIESLPSTTTGSIIKRRRNSKALDLLNADAFSVVIDHIDQMEQWAAFAEFNKDVNALLSYKRFRNQVQNMSSVYGSGTTLWNNFKDVARIAGNSYHPQVGRNQLDTAAVNLAKGVTSAKISFRVYTALKQFLSMPAFVADANIAYLAKNMATPWKAWNWAMENLPVFEKRWKSRIAGDTRLMSTEADWKFFRTKLYDQLSKLGMSPNAFVDALTVAIGSRSMYETRYDRYVKEGYSEAEADKKAKQDATVLYNETQQSNENAFVSSAQLDRTVFSTAITVFRNSSMGYQRQLHDALRNLGKHFKSGYKEQSIEFMTKQLVRDGLSEEQAAAAAEKRYNRSVWRDSVRVATFGFLVQFAWNLGSSIAYLLFGDDDDEKEKMLLEAARHALIGGTMEGLAGGNVMSEALNMVAKGENLRNYDPTLLPIISDMKRVYSMMGYDWVAGTSELVNLAVQAGIGVNPQTLSDTVVAVIDACEGDMDLSREAMLLVMRVLQVPQSQIDQIYIDELGMSAARARRMSPTQMARRYADYKLNRNAGAMRPFYPKELEDKRRKAHEKRFKELVKERKK